ncbi:MAG: class I SAM-dependent methyltransferase [Calditrichaeota bacterium]|nr:class I SAM-dependent methyltransferase [Calditrichota bacterium]
MKGSQSELVENFLAQADIHQKWIQTYYSAENEAFCEREFDYVTKILNAPQGSVILDAGCGNCAHSIRLAKRGFVVEAVDCSETVLTLARENVKSRGLEDRIHIQHGNLLALPFEDGTFGYALCCGVLMHIPDLEKAIAELARVLRSGGQLVVSEANMYSLEAVVLRSLRRLLKKGKAVTKNTPAGVEYWTTDATGALLTRQANMQWLIREFRSHGLSLRKRLAGQFTELYTRISSKPFNKLIHAFNGFWFSCMKIPYWAFGNLLIFEKEVFA